jgi:hypothetical protein
MVVLQLPQFPAQNDSGEGDGVPPISRWFEAATTSRNTALTTFANLNLEPEVEEVFSRLQFLLSDTRNPGLSTTDLHDLTCFVLHRLIRPAQTNQNDGTYDRAASECIRHATVLYMLIIHGPAYFSHAQLQYTTAAQLKANLDHLSSFRSPNHHSLILWFLSVGMVASDGTPDCMWFMEYARKVGEELGVFSWEQVLFHLKSVIWLGKQQAEIVFQRKWDGIWAANT